MKKRKHRIMYIEMSTGGGSTISLLELVRSLDRTMYEPVVLFHRANLYVEKFQNLEIELITLQNEISFKTQATLSRRIASMSERHRRWLLDVYHEAKNVYKFVRYDFPSAISLGKLIKNRNIDLVHHNNGLSNSRPFLIAARHAGVPQVCHLRSFYDLPFINKYLAHYISSFIYISKAVENSYVKQGISSQKGVVIFNPVEVNSLDSEKHVDDIRSELGLLDNDFLITNVGRLILWKGHDYFLHAIAEVIKFQPNVKALIVGGVSSNPQSEVYYRRLKQLVLDLQISDHVIFAGHRSDVIEILRASDLVVHSASEPEPFGRVVIEGMLVARPVIATAGGGILEIIEHNITGLLVPPRDPNSMAQAIKYLIRHPNQARKLGDRALKVAKDRFSIARHLNRIQATYRNILQDNQS